MSRVAVAGGTGGLGSCIVEAIVSAKKHEVFVLAREATDKLDEFPGVTVLAVDYDSPDAMAETLDSNKIDTVISALSMTTPATHAAQLNLIRAAAKSSTVKRFAPSEFGLDHIGNPSKGDPLLPFEEPKIAAVTLLKTTRLEHTRFVTGIFMDYFAPPGAPSRLRTISAVVDHANRKAVVPGDGDVPVALTHSADVGRFVAAALDLPRWDEMSLVEGDRVTLNELVARAEDAAGAKFQVVHATIAEVETGQLEELPCNVPKYQFIPEAVVGIIRRTAGLMMANGLQNFEPDVPRLNDKFPDLKPMSVKDFFEKYS